MLQHLFSRGQYHSFSVFFSMFTSFNQWQRLLAVVHCLLTYLFQPVVKFACLFFDFEILHLHVMGSRSLTNVRSFDAELLLKWRKDSEIIVLNFCNLALNFVWSSQQFLSWNRLFQLRTDILGRSVHRPFIGIYWCNVPTSPSHEASRLENFFSFDNNLSWTKKWIN